MPSDNYPQMLPNPPLKKKPSSRNQLLEPRRHLTTLCQQMSGMATTGPLGGKESARIVALADVLKRWSSHPTHSKTKSGTNHRWPVLVGTGALTNKTKTLTKQS